MSNACSISRAGQTPPRDRSGCVVLLRSCRALEPYGSLTFINRGAASTPSRSNDLFHPLTHAGALSHLLERLSSFPLAKPQAAQRAKCFAMRYHRLRIHLGAKASAIGVLKAQSRRHSTLDAQKPLVQRLMVRAAENRQSILVVIASLRRSTM